MTRAESIEILKELWRYKHTEKYAENEIREALEIAINSLKVDEMYQLEYEKADEFIPKSVIEDIKVEQEPILDKIRAEIIELRSRQNVGVLECLDIIDKYKSESEDNDDKR